MGTQKNSSFRPETDKTTMPLQGLNESWKSWKEEEACCFPFAFCEFPSYLLCSCKHHADLIFTPAEIVHSAAAVGSSWQFHQHPQNLFHCALSETPRPASQHPSSVSPSPPPSSEIAGGRPSQEARVASVKMLRQEHTWCD